MMTNVNIPCLAALALGAIAAAPGRAEGPKAEYRFDLGPGPAAPGWIKVPPSTAYSREVGHGFEPGPKVEGVDRGGPDPVRGDFVTSSRPFAFSVAVPEGNYRVAVTLGDPAGGSTATVKAESRRLMLEGVRTEGGASTNRTFVVNVRSPKLASGGSVKLKPRERDVPDWDDKLTLEFLDDRPCVASIEVARADDAVTVFLAGDSTVTDQAREPWNSWGQMLPRSFGPGVAVANHAESGESLRSFQAGRRLEKILDAIRPKDYLFVQFGHNDQKERGAGVGALTTYKASLEHYVAEARRRGANPVVVTPVSRRSFGPGGKIVSNLGDFPEAVRRVAKERDLPLIDLNALSVVFYEALGPEGSRAAFVAGDNTHHNNYGSYELARAVAERIRRSVPGLAGHLRDDLGPFDPAHPDPVAAFRVPPSPPSPAAPPDGS